KVDEGGRATYSCSAATSKKVITGRCRPARILQVCMRIHTAGKHHTASRVDDLGLSIVETTANRRNDAIHDEDISMIIVCRRDNAAILHQRVHITISQYSDAPDY